MYFHLTNGRREPTLVSLAKSLLRDILLLSPGNFKIILWRNVDKGSLSTILPIATRMPEANTGTLRITFQIGA